MSYKERVDYKLTVKLRHDKIITTLDDPFKQFDQIEIDSLLANGMLLPLQYNFTKYARARLFQFRLVHEIKKTKLTSHMKSLIF